MPPAIDLFGATVLLLGLTALGLSVIFEASRLSTAAGRQALIRRRIQARERETLEQKIRVDGMEAETVAKQAALDGLLAERARILAATSALKLSKIEMVHEIGDPEPGAVLYHGDLRSGGETAGRPEQRRIVFAREIWDRNNVAHIWAETPESAMAAIRRAFSNRSGIAATRVQRAPFPRMDVPPSDGQTKSRGDSAPNRPALRVASRQRAA